MSGKNALHPVPSPARSPPKKSATLNPGMVLGVAATLQIRIWIRHAECYVQLGFRGKVALLWQICSPTPESVSQ
ncbi:MAG: hypothetical protein U1D41_14580 [Nitrosomonas sp.]|uniref:hypothetical protein n=1 Tax=Nitrosomonas sp. TaxID=42353 RepID=UPI002AB7F5C1|nr:hypothetical protein [Nitrosomonas sp.]MDZ4107353.1 hypothetical protein [Nitrosomonas sp.]